MEEERREEPVIEVEERREEPVEVVEERGSGVRSRVQSKESRRGERKRSLTEGDEIIDQYWKKFNKVREVGDLEVEIVTSSNSLDGGFQPGELRQAFNSGKIKFNLPYRIKISSDVIQRLISTEKLYARPNIITICNTSTFKTFRNGQCRTSKKQKVGSPSTTSQ